MLSNDNDLLSGQGDDKKRLPCGCTQAEHDAMAKEMGMDGGDVSHGVGFESLLKGMAESISGLKPSEITNEKMEQLQEGAIGELSHGSWKEMFNRLNSMGAANEQVRDIAKLGHLLGYKKATEQYFYSKGMNQALVLITKAMQIRIDRGDGDSTPVVLSDAIMVGASNQATN